MKVVLVFLIALMPCIAFSKVNLELKKGSTEFLAVGNPGFLKINAKGDAPSGEGSIVGGMMNVKAKVNLSSFDTGMSLRNKHMKEKYLEVEKYPEAILEIKDYKIPNWSEDSIAFSSKKIPATITIHGESKPVVLSAKLSEKGELNSSFKLKISDFKIGIPSFMGVTVADKVTVKVSSQVLAKKND